MAPMMSLRLQEKVSSILKPQLDVLLEVQYYLGELKASSKTQKDKLNASLRKFKNSVEQLQVFFDWHVKKSKWAAARNAAARAAWLLTLGRCTKAEPHARALLQPVAMARFLELLGDATVPCALVSLGLFLAQPQPAAPRGAAGLVLIKLIVQPALVWGLAMYVFHLPPLWAKAALLLSALPTGTGPFMLAEFYGREAAVVARAVLWSTLGSLVTLSVCLLWLG